MPNAIYSLDGNKRAMLRLGYFGTDALTGPPRTGTVKQLTPDGDTITATLRPGDNVAMRFLGIDTPEKRLPLPFGDPDSFVTLDSPLWMAYLDAPFSAGTPFTASLTSFIEALTADGGAAMNHFEHGQLAEDELEGFVEADIAEYLLAGLIADRSGFRFFAQFAYEVMEGYGRFLCFVNRDQPDGMEPSPRPPDYNTRMLASGRASPYFIWPNVNPFRVAGSILAAVIPPGSASVVAASDPKLSEARAMVRQARTAGIGIFDPVNPLRLEAFELRFLSRQKPPDRWVIDLTKQDDILLHPQNYFSIPRAEDRLFINPEHVPLFLQAGWVRQEAPL
jgi:hypothetical protein